MKRTFNNIRIGATMYILDVSDLSVCTDIITEMSFVSKRYSEGTELAKYREEDIPIEISGNKWFIPKGCINSRRGRNDTAEFEMDGSTFEIYLDKETLEERVKELFPSKISNLIDNTFSITGDVKFINNIISKSWV